jgi:hypothetical protein
MATKLTRLTHKIAIQLNLVAESCTICSSHSRRLIQKLLDTLSYGIGNVDIYSTLQSVVLFFMELTDTITAFT